MIRKEFIALLGNKGGPAECTNYEITTLEETDTLGKFEMSPLPDQFGITLGNSLRRVLLSAIPGGAVFSIRIDDVYHEFTGVEGVTEERFGDHPEPEKTDSEYRYQRQPRFIHCAFMKQDHALSLQAIFSARKGLKCLTRIFRSVLCLPVRNFPWKCRPNLAAALWQLISTSTATLSPNSPIGVIYTDSLFSPVVRVRLFHTFGIQRGPQAL